MALRDAATGWPLEGLERTEGRHEALPLERLVWGTGVLRSLAPELAERDVRRAALLTTGPLPESLVGRVEEALGDLHAYTVRDLPAHVPESVVLSATQDLLGHDVDALVSLGGGSVIDGTKAIAAGLTPQGGRPPLHASLPTTLAGAELSHFYGVTRTGPQGEHVKQSYVDRSSTPALVILDPLVTQATPAALWAGSGLKAIDHAVEMIVAPGRRPVADIVALAGIRGLATHLVTSLDDADDGTARLECQIAAWQCYASAGNARLGLSHRIGHVLGGTFGVPHSATSSITLPAVLRVMAAREPHRVATIAAALAADTALSFDPDPAAASMAAPRLERLVASLGLPARLRDVGVTPPQVAEIASLVLALYPDECRILGSEPLQPLTALLEEIL
ncbi:MAG: iron-containing alcohol dehydrogenase [Conexibacter sp.]